MITASALEFIPRGRSAVDEHPGPLVIKKQQAAPVEFMLLSRMQNINISSDNPTEFWSIREISLTKATKSKKVINKLYDVIEREDELYVKGHTAVWTRGLAENGHSMPYVALTCETNIKFAFFCPPSFVSSNTLDNDDDHYGIGLLDSHSLRVYFKSGEDYMTAIENPISKVWVTRQSLILEKDPSCTEVGDRSIAMPRFFSLKHPLNEMCPLLIKNVVGVSYIVEADYKIIFSSPETDLILMFDIRTGKHFVCRLRDATVDEINKVANTAGSDVTYSSMNVTTNIGMHSISGMHSMKGTSMSKTNLSGFHRSFSVNAHSSPLRGHLSTPGHGNQSIGTSTLHSPLQRLQSTVMTSHTLQDLRVLEQTEALKPIVPELCLDTLWVDNSTTQEFNEAASHAFLHKDLVGQTYLCYLMPHTFRLNLAKISKTPKVRSDIFEAVTSIPAKDAVELKKIFMIAILAPDGNVMLYSGTTLVGKVHVGGILLGLSTATNMRNSLSSFPKRSSLLPMATTPKDFKFDEELHMLSPVLPIQVSPSVSSKTNCQELRDPAGKRLTLVYPGKMYRISLPPLYESVLVKKCLNVLRLVLQRDSAIQLLTKWYSTRNVPGSQNYSPTEEWDAFKLMLLELIGRVTVDTAHNTSNDSNGPKKRRKSDATNSSDSDWDYLNSVKGEHSHVVQKSEKYLTTAVLFSELPVVFYSLHLLYEDMKLDTSLSAELESLGTLLYLLAMEMNLQSYVYHYFLDFPWYSKGIKTQCRLTENDLAKLKKNGFDFTAPPPSIFSFINAVVRNLKCTPYPYMAKINDMSKNIAIIVTLIFERSQDFDSCINYIRLPGGGSQLYAVADKQKPAYSNTATFAEKILLTLIDMKITRSTISSLPVALHFILAQSLENCRMSPPIGCSSEAYKLLLRSELKTHAEILENDIPTTINVKTTIGSNLNTKEHSLSPRVPAQPDVMLRTEKRDDDDGMEFTDTKLLRLRFPKDLRVNTVRTFLNSSKPATIDIVQQPSVSDHEFIEEQEKQLFSICIRTMALPIGRGIFTLRTTNPSCTESLSIPKLCLSGKEVHRGATIELQQIEVPPNMTTWPLFHNGVATGLKISSDWKDVDSTWIIYNKPKANSEQTSEHAGFLMALGLNGHLKTLSFMSIYEYLVKCDEMTSVGLLLGVSATNRGTQDTKTTKLLSVHIEALLPPTAVELDIPQNVQVASLMGIGLVYEGTAKRHIAEVLLQEIGRPPGPEMENYVERESYALTAGLALGLVTLGLGESSTCLRDLNVSDTLHYYMVGGNKRPLTGAQKDKYKLASFQIREGDTVNIDVTSPGATLALGLMFFQTSNEAVANWMKPPDTKYLLDFIRPDLLQLRIIARGLIMWHSVEPTTQWINSNVPPSLAKLIKERPDQDDLTVEIDHEANCQAYCNIITGASICMGLRFAGTDDPQAFHTLKKVMDFFLYINTQWQYISEFAGKATIESCAVMVLIALSLVCAGTGNTHVLKIIRMMRARIGNSHSQVTYGSHMAIHMALGFLFLGAGRYTLSRSPQAIAALVISLFPKFPNHSSDNRYHLQAFRHFYVMAVEARLFLPRDIDTGKLALCNLCYVELKSNEVKNIGKAPCMLPELDTLKSVYIDDDAYWPVHFERDRNWDQLIKILQFSDCIDIKKRAGCFSHLEDPNRLQTLLAQTLSTEHKPWYIEPSSLTSFSSDQNIQNFATKFLFPLLATEIDNVGAVSKLEEKLVHQLVLQSYDCLTQDRMHALPIYIQLMAIQSKLERHETPQSYVWQIKILISILGMYMDHVAQKDFLLSLEILNSIAIRYKKTIEDIYMLRKPNVNAGLETVLKEQNLELHELNQLAMIWQFYDFRNRKNEVEFGCVNIIQYILKLKQEGFSTHEIAALASLSLDRN